MKGMITDHPPLCHGPFAQTLTHELLGRAGIVPGMRVLVPGAGLGEVAFLVAERVGPSGRVFAIDADERAVATARDSAAQQCFADIDFRVQSLGDFDVAGLDAVVGRFFLMRETDPAAALRNAAAHLRPGGRLVFHEWHFESMLWEQTSHWPDLPLYRTFAGWSIETLRRCGVHVDMGLRLINAFAEAALPLPATRTELAAVRGEGRARYAFFEDTLRELLPDMERLGIATACDVDVDTFAERLEREVVTTRGHAFLPLQVAAWTRVEDPVTRPAERHR